MPTLKLVYPVRILLSLKSLKISLYVRELVLPIIKNFLLCSMSWATYSRNREKGGLVTTMSACLSSSMHSSLRKSPPSLSGVAVFLSGSSSHFTSAKLTAPSALLSETSLISILKGCFLSLCFKPSTLNKRSWPPAIGEGT